MNMTTELLNEIKTLANTVSSSLTKSASQKDSRRLEFIHSQLKGVLNGYVSGKLGKVVNYAQAASGQVSDKAHWISNMEEALYIFENEVTSSLDL